MLRWLLTLLLVVLVVNRFLGAAAARRSAPRQPIDPDDARQRGNSRHGHPLSPYEIEDAEYEEIPTRPR